MGNQADVRIAVSGGGPVHIPAEREQAGFRAYEVA